MWHGADCVIRFALYLKRRVRNLVTRVTQDVGKLRFRSIEFLINSKLVKLRSNFLKKVTPDVKAAGFCKWYLFNFWCEVKESQRTYLSTYVFVGFSNLCAKSKKTYCTLSLITFIFYEPWNQLLHTFRSVWMTFFYRTADIFIQNFGVSCIVNAVQNNECH